MWTWISQFPLGSSFFVYLRRILLRITGKRFFTRQLFFLPVNRMYQYTERSTKHWPNEWSFLTAQMMGRQNRLHHLVTNYLTTSQRQLIKCIDHMEKQPLCDNKCPKQFGKGQHRCHIPTYEQALNFIKSWDMPPSCEWIWTPLTGFLEPIWFCPQMASGSN